MRPLVVATVAFVVVFGGALLGMLLRNVLPADHLESDSKDVVKLGMGLVATMTALVLGLVTASAKHSFDTQDAALKRSAAKIMLLDRMLAQYGPETNDVRAQLKGIATFRLRLMWPEEENRKEAARLDAPELTPTAERLTKALRELTPKDESQRWLQQQALKITSELMEARWMMLGSVGSSIQTYFLVVVVFWLSMIFASFGLFAPHNATVVTVLLVGALSVAASLFLIIEMDDPFNGLMKVSSAPIRYAISELGQ